MTAATANTDYVTPSGSISGNAGSATKLADFNIGNADLNTLKGATYWNRIGYSGGGNSCANKPANVNAFGLLIFRAAAGWTFQMLFRQDNNYVYARRGDDANGWQAWYQIYPTTNISGNAGTATKLKTARTFPAVNLAGTGTASFDGSADPTAVGVSGTLPVSHGGTGAATASAALTALGGVPTTRKVNGKALSADVTLGAGDIKFTDGQTFQQKLDAGTLKGDKGDKGNAGSQGAAGPNTVSTSTGTNITGLLKGNGSKVAAAVANKDYLAVDSPSFTGNLTGKTSCSDADVNTTLETMNLPSDNGLSVSTLSVAANGKNGTAKASSSVGLAIMAGGGMGRTAITVVGDNGTAASKSTLIIDTTAGSDPEIGVQNGTSNTKYLKLGAKSDGVLLNGLSAPVSDTDAATKKYVDSSYVRAGQVSGSEAGVCATAEGNQTTASGYSAHAEGEQTTADGAGPSHAEGYLTTATASGPFIAAHAEGNRTIATGGFSHAEGLGTKASADASHAGGRYTIASANSQTAIGKYNVEEKSEANALFIIGNGTSDTARSNALRVTGSGAVYAKAAYNSSGADYAEMFEWQDGNPDGEDRVGLFAVLDGEKIRLAEAGDEDILGVISGEPSVTGDMYGDQWKGMYLTDVYGRAVWETVTVPAVTDGNGGVIVPEHEETRLKLNPDYDPSKPYVSRAERREWDCVGLLGKLVMRDDGTAVVNGYVGPGAGGVATRSEAKTAFRVMARLDETHIRVLIR